MDRFSTWCEARDFRRSSTYGSDLDEKFKNWLSSKLQIKIGKFLGQGTEGIVYELDEFRVIKIVNDTGPQFKNVVRLVNKKIPGLVRYYAAGEIDIPVRFQWDSVTRSGIENFSYSGQKAGYVIMERVIVTKELKNKLSKVLNTFVQYWNEVEKPTKYDIPTEIMVGTTALFKLFRSHEKYDKLISSFIKWLGDPMNGFGSSDLQKLALKMLKTIKTLQNYGIDPADLNHENWGISKTRGLVLFDFWDKESHKKTSPYIKNKVSE